MIEKGENNEMCVVSYNGNIYICIKKVQFVNGKKEINYIAITNKKKMFSFDEIDDRFGYVVGFLHPNGTLGRKIDFKWGFYTPLFLFYLIFKTCNFVYSSSVIQPFFTAFLTINKDHLLVS